MRTLSIDIETYSSIDIRSCGAYRYTVAPDFEILLFAYAFDDEEIKIVDLASGGKLPKEITEALIDPEILKTAYNANFERTGLTKYLKMHLPVEQWWCTAVHSAMLGLPGKLEDVAKVMGLEAQKDTSGTALINYFSKPCKPTKTNGRRTRNYPEHAPDKWQKFKDYCVQDVNVEREIKRGIEFFPVPESEKKLWYVDQKINDRGVKVDLEFIKNAMWLNEDYSSKLIAKAGKLTGLDNPNSVAQIKKWIEETEGITVESLNKEFVPELIKNSTNPAVKEMLGIRQELSKTSIKKYNAMAVTVSPYDGRIRGLLQFYGANRTGRWAGRLVQVQNLKRNHMHDLDTAREILKDGELELMEMLYPVSDTLSQLVRTAFVPSEGCRFMVADFSAIEARVIAWLAGEQWRLDVFNSHGKIYEASASQMFRVPIEEITKDSPLRQKGKVAELALGYQGGPGALINMGALDMGIPEEELPVIVDAWRNSNKAIVRLWYDVDRAAKKAIREGGVVSIQKGIKFIHKNNYLFIRLPSGRHLAYPKVKFGKNRFGNESILYEGLNQTSKKWGKQETYGGKLVENIIQATARDCLAVSILRLEEAGYPIVMHIHDEVIIDKKIGEGSLEEVNRIMGLPIDWAPGLPLTADSYETMFYKKD